MPFLGDTATSAGIATIVATAITSFTGWAIARSARIAGEKKDAGTSRTDLEKEAFERARKFYIDTIERQDGELEECRRVEAELRKELESVQREAREEARNLRQRIDELERKLGTAERRLRAFGGGL